MQGIIYALPTIGLPPYLGSTSEVSGGSLSGTANVSVSGSGILQVGLAGDALTVLGAGGDLTRGLVGEAFFNISGQGDIGNSLSGESIILFSAESALAILLTGDATVNIGAEGHIVQPLVGDAITSISGQGTLNATLTGEATVGISASGILNSLMFGSAGFDISASGNLAQPLTGDATVSVGASGRLLFILTGDAVTTVSATGVVGIALSGDADVSVSGEGHILGGLVGDADVSVGGEGQISVGLMGESSFSIQASGVLGIGLSGEAVVSVLSEGHVTLGIVGEALISPSAGGVLAILLEGDMVINVSAEGGLTGALDIVSECGWYIECDRIRARRTIEQRANSVVNRPMEFELDTSNSITDVISVTSSDPAVVVERFQVDVNSNHAISIRLGTDGSVTTEMIVVITATVQTLSGPVMGEGVLVVRPLDPIAQPSGVSSWQTLEYDEDNDVINYDVQLGKNAVLPQFDDNYELMPPANAAVGAGGHLMIQGGTYWPAFNSSEFDFGDLGPPGQQLDDTLGTLCSWVKRRNNTIYITWVAGHRW